VRNPEASGQVIPDLVRQGYLGPRPPSGIRIMRRLDVSKLSEEAIAYLTVYEGGPELVDDLPRDYIWSDEIIAATEEFVLVSPDGEILDKAFETIAEAEKARDGAKLIVQFTLADDPPVVPETMANRLGYTAKGRPLHG
jgi:hypothetical protein